jgi:biotin synthase-like enzyme
MKIFSIEVGILPHDCYVCDLSGDYHDMGNIDCFIIKESVLDYAHERHPDCPLRQVWVASYQESGIIKP